MRLTPTKLSLWDLLQQYKSHREALNDILKNIKISSEDPNTFVDFYALVQDYTRPSITFYMDEIYHSPGSSQKYLAIYIMAYIDNKGVKWVMIDDGLAINVDSIVALHHLNIYLSYLSAHTLAIKAFNNTLSSTLVVVVLPLRVGTKSIPTTCHVVEGDMQSNILLGHLRIDEMDDVSSSRYAYFKYLYEENMHYIPMDVNPFTY